MHQSSLNRAWDDGLLTSGGLHEVPIFEFLLGFAQELTFLSPGLRSMEQMGGGDWIEDGGGTRKSREESDDNRSDIDLFFVCQGSSPAMSSRTYHCRGCDSTGFNWRGYVQHVRLSRDELCKHAFTTDFGLRDDANVGLPTKAIPFEGDALGSAADYSADDFGQGLADSDSVGDIAMDFAPSEDGVIAEFEGQDQDISDPADDSDDDGLEREMQAELENAWEPDRPGAPLEAPAEMHDTEEDQHDNNGDLANQVREERASIEGPLIGPPGHGPSPSARLRFTEKHRSSRCGQKLGQHEAVDVRYQAHVNGESNLWAPFKSKMDWEIAKWAKLRGPGSTAFSELLAIDGVFEALGLSYKNADTLNKIIDNNLPGRPRFTRHEVLVDGEALEFFARDIIECIKALWGDADFIVDLIFEPERQYADDTRRVRIYHDMNTGKWWWDIQKKVEADHPGEKCTIIPVIISSDKTQLTQFRNKTAYPVYLTIGNLPKHIRRKPSRQGQVLLAYLPTSKLDHITNKAARRRTLANLFHNCMKFVMKPLEGAGKDGIVMVSGDGAARRCFPIFAAYVGDYPEQVLVTLVKNGDCVVCDIDHDLLEDLDSTGCPRDIDMILDALETLQTDGLRAFVKACAEAGVKAIPNPFWKDLPYVNIYESITPDILHQLYQGLIKHLVLWIRSVCTDAEIDARCRRFPPNHNVRLFLKGLSPLSRITGTEHDQICRILLGLVMDVHLPSNVSNVRLVRTVRAALDFLYLAKYPIHTSETLAKLDEALLAFHANRDVFIDLGVRDHFNIPKLHYMGHYRFFIEQFGTPDNFNTEYTERLHIDLAKDAYRASNHKDEYPQMTAWLDRKEKVLQHDKYVRRRLEVLNDIPPPVKPLPSLILRRTLQMALHPTVRGVRLSTIREAYGATFFEAALSRFVIQYQHPDYNKAQIEAASNVSLPFYKLPVYHRLKFVSHDPYSLDPTAKDVVDSIHVEPASEDRNGKVVPGRFDTAVPFTVGLPITSLGYAVAQVRCIFSLPDAALKTWFPRGAPSKHFAYVEWFTPFSKAVFDPNSRLYRIKRLRVRGEQQASVIPVSLIRQSVHLFPKFGPVAPVHWKSSNVLEEAPMFYVNPFSDRFAYSTLY
ncbi:hypothetical protein CVT26_010525 [Gymnopilus dilepis]|uniref:Uncharacterized protein n=1 Tax=Gymnopilus dilepis TaxID=231916 RepID=A0A409W547_9AGAR|nr:hypothetical protein CVT26_010525 [Gymnopilus dilepis]